MPNEVPHNEKSKNEKSKKTKKRFSSPRRDYVDTFRWGFVPEDAAGKTDAKTSVKPEERGTVKTKTDSRSASKKRTKTTKTCDCSAPKKHAKAVSKTDKSGEESTRAVAKTAERSSPKKRSGTTAKRAKSSAKPGGNRTGRTAVKTPTNPYTAPNYDEHDDDLRLPSYGRTPVPTDDELPVPTKTALRKPVQKTTSAPEPHKANFQAAANIQAPEKLGDKPKDRSTDSPVCEVSSGGFRPRKEQMVWDPDKSEYVPLVVKHEKPKPEPHKKTENRAGSPEQPSSAKSTEKRRKKAVKKTDNVKAGGREDVAPPAVCEETPPKKHPDKKRGDVPKFVKSPQPDPTDVESEVSGFAELGVSETMLEALKIVRYLAPTPIQAGVFQMVRAGTDLMGQARTGTGKTAAFSMPIIEGVETCPPGNDPVAIILVPTRELAVQVRDEAIRLTYGRDIRITACYGGKPIGKQIERLRSGIDILVGTPGRILDLMNRRALFLDSIRWVVLDEADRMLDIGFRPDIEKILKRTPQERQTLLFSATLPPPVVRLAEKYMKSPEMLDFSNKSVAVDTIEQFYITVDPERKFDALVYLLEEQQPRQAIIFTRTKRGADRLARLLDKQFENLAAIHGDMQQSDRDRVMAQVRAGKIRYLVATDVVGRGIDVSSVSHIINYDIPKFCDDYVHRVGRTGRMGRDGVAFTFVTVQEGSELTRIEMRIDKLLQRAELKGFESFTKPHDPNASLDEEPPEPPKPVFGKPVRKVRRAL